MSKSRLHQREHDSNQQVAKSVRPQLPRDGSPGHDSLAIPVNCLMVAIARSLICLAISFRLLAH
jgi:hypothetical protein